MSILENPIPNEVLDNATSPLTDDKAAYKDSTYEIVSKVAYLIGVPKRIFDNEHEAPKVEVYNRLDSDKTARMAHFGTGSFLSGWKMGLQSAWRISCIAGYGMGWKL